MKTGKQYIEEMKAMRPNVYKDGELILDVTTHPATKTHIETVAQWYDKSFDPECADIYTTTSVLTGKKTHRWNALFATADDLAKNMDMKREAWRLSGSCMGGVCTGWVVVNSLWGTTYDIDKACGTNYHERLKNFAIMAEEKALSLSGAITDGKGNRALRPGQQENPNAYLHVKEVRPDGIVLEGYKIQICATVGSQYVLVMPTMGMREGEEKFAVAAAIPRDAEGLTCVEARHPSDNRGDDEGFDTIHSGITQAYLIFEDVFVPNEYVFMNGEVAFTDSLVGNFSAVYRACIGACVAGQGDIMIGAALGMARANGLTQKPFQDRFTKMVVNNETNYAVGMGAIFKGGQHPSGVYYPNVMLSHLNKVHAASLPNETKLLAQDIAGGIAETGCMPSFKDFQSPLYGEKIAESLDAAAKGRDRAKLARLLEWMIVGAGVSGCLHGGGSPDTAKSVLRMETDWNKYVEYARNLAQVEDPLADPKKAK